MSMEQVKCLSSHRTVTISEGQTIFTDSLDQLECLEYISRLQLIIAYLRCNNSVSAITIGKYLTDKPDFEFQMNVSNDVNVHELSLILRKLEIETAQKTQNSISKGIRLNFEDLCLAYDLDEFERSIVLLLFAKNTGKKFRDLYSFCQTDSNRLQDGGMSVGVILSVLWPCYRDQIINRKYFSAGATLIKNDIVVTWGGFDETTNILDESYYLHERVVRFIIGDDNVYNTDYACVTKIKSSVKMEQVILPENLKQDMMTLAENYINPKTQDDLISINKFYGYGTGMTFFLYGPSGTGKTMFAYALANKLGKDVFMMNAEKASDMRVSFDKLLKHIFMEAKLSNGIVFFDECDDIFLANTSESRDLLIEIEKAECITIMATNKVIDLDPALDRRITMKVPFELPNSTQREKIWRTLIPPTIRIGEDVDFKKLSEQYIFSGGLIKNTLFLAISYAMDKNGTSNITITANDIEKAANHQSASIFDMKGFGEICFPNKAIENLPLRASTKTALVTIASAYNKLKTDESGLKIVIKSSHIQIGVESVEAVAKMCDLDVRKFMLADVILRQINGEKFKDPVSHREVTSIEYAFSPSLGPQSIILFVDHSCIIDRYFSKDQNDRQNEVIAFFDRLKNYKGLLFVVTAQLQLQRTPFEFDHYLKIDKPHEEVQIRQWEKNIRHTNFIENDLIDLVERYPLHLDEIDILSKRASLLNCLNNGVESITIESAIEAIHRHNNIQGGQILFGK